MFHVLLMGQLLRVVRKLRDHEGIFVPSRHDRNTDQLKTGFPWGLVLLQDLIAVTASANGVQEAVCATLRQRNNVVDGTIIRIALVPELLAVLIPVVELADVIIALEHRFLTERNSRGLRFEAYELHQPDNKRHLDLKRQRANLFGLMRYDDLDFFLYEPLQNLLE